MINISALRTEIKGGSETLTFSSVQIVLEKRYRWKTKEAKHETQILFVVTSTFTCR